MDLARGACIKAKLRRGNFDLVARFARDSCLDERLAKHCVIFGLRHDLHPNALEIEVFIAVFLGIEYRLRSSERCCLAICRLVRAHQRSQKGSSLDAFLQAALEERT